MKPDDMLSTFFKSKSIGLAGCLMMCSLTVAAQPPAPSTMSNPLAQMLVFIMILLLLAIALLANVVNGAANIFREKIRKEREAAAKQDSGTAAMLVVVLIASGLLVSGGLNAQEATTAAPKMAQTFNGLSATSFYLLIGVIGVEILILIALAYQLRFLIGIETKKAAKVQAEAAAKPKESWWWKLNKAASAEQEKDIDLSHDYDGISELDNKLPPWWIAAFAITILFSCVYLWRYHVSHSAPLQIEELEIAMQEAEAAKAIYLAKSANNVDENTVKMLDDGGIAAGKALFAANCIACHGSNGEGNAVGPNLTDKYWLHGGAINDVFKTIKYGVVEKGMRSWKDDFSPIQLAQLASFIKSLEGSNPANAREPQGQLYEEGATPAADSAAGATVRR
jgi:cytochrome c oxidase cbb3-type subunit 3